jgi:hypothetical protein
MGRFTLLHTKSKLHEGPKIQHGRWVVKALNTQRVIQCFVFMAMAFMASGCATGVTLAPGADQIKVTQVPTDVAACVAVGNVDGENGSGLTIDGIRQMQNQTVGVGGNTVLVTSDISPQKGIAYRCDPAGRKSR